MIGRGVHIHTYIISLWSKKKFESYFRDRLTFSNVDSRTSRRIYRLALLLRAPETLSSLSKSRISIFNAHLTLGTERRRLQTRMQNWKEVNIWSSTVYSCDFLFS